MSAVDIAIVGAGPAGLAAATKLAVQTTLNVVVLERESEPGGIPRHSDHTGYGLRDLRTVMRGPAYARRLTADALAAGVTIRTDTMVTGWGGDTALELTSPQGRHVLHARAVILATGARERPRAARLIPGDRGAGVYTTGQLQGIVYLKGAKVGLRAVVVGAEPVSYSAVLTLKHAGCATALMITGHAKPESYQLFNIAARTPVLGVRVATRTRLCRIIGKPRVTGVEIENLDTGVRQIVDCDTVVLTGDWVPDHELARTAGLDIDPGTSGPLVDTALRTSRPGVFAAGNLLHPVDTADVAALDGRHVAGQVAAYLGGRRAAGDGVRLQVSSPLRWVAPGIIRPGDPHPARNRLLLWTDELIRRPEVIATQDGRVVGHTRLRWPASPGRAFRVPFGVMAGADLTGGPITLTVS